MTTVLVTCGKMSTGKRRGEHRCEEMYRTGKTAASTSVTEKAFLEQPECVRLTETPVIVTTNRYIYQREF